MYSFTDWFKKVFPPHANRLVGTKLLLVDNLRSHISAEVINLCQENDIKFVCLIPDSTDKTQPLDVGYFAPLKKKWRNMLRAKKAINPNFNAVAKQDFPANLKELMKSVDAKS